MILGANIATSSQEAKPPKKVIASVVIARLGILNVLSCVLCALTFIAVILPLVGTCLGYGLIKLNLLPNDVVLTFMLMVQFSMPSAVNLIVAAQVAGYGSAQISTILFWEYSICCITISFWCIIVQWLIL